VAEERDDVGAEIALTVSAVVAAEVAGVGGTRLPRMLP
jgi:hypothetical protein